MNEEKKIISPISCEKEPMATVYYEIVEFARLKDIPFSLAVRKFLYAGSAAMSRTFKLKGKKNEKNKS